MRPGACPLVLATSCIQFRLHCPSTAPDSLTLLGLCIFLFYNDTNITTHDNDDDDEPQRRYYDSSFFSALLSTSRHHRSESKIACLRSAFNFAIVHFSFWNRRTPSSSFPSVSPLNPAMLSGRASVPHRSIYGFLIHHRSLLCLFIITSSSSSISRISSSASGSFCKHVQFFFAIEVVHSSSSNICLRSGNRIRLPGCRQVLSSFRLAHTHSLHCPNINHT